MNTDVRNEPFNNSHIWLQYRDAACTRKLFTIRDLSMFHDFFREEKYDITHDALDPKKRLFDADRGH